MDKVASHTFGPLWVEGGWLQVLVWDQGPIFVLDNCPAGNQVNSCYHISLEGPRSRKCVKEASLRVSTAGDHPCQVINRHNCTTCCPEKQIQTINNRTQKGLRQNPGYWWAWCGQGVTEQESRERHRAAHTPQNERRPQEPHRGPPSSVPHPPVSESAPKEAHFITRKSGLLLTTSSQRRS